MEEKETKEMSSKEISRRSFLQWMGVGAVGGAVAGMGAFSYSPNAQEHPCNT